MSNVLTSNSSANDPLNISFPSRYAAYNLKAPVTVSRLINTLTNRQVWWAICSTLSVNFSKAELSEMQQLAEDVWTETSLVSLALSKVWVAMAIFRQEYWQLNGRINNVNWSSDNFSIRVVGRNESTEFIILVLLKYTKMTVGQQLQVVRKCTNLIRLLFSYSEYYLH